MGKIMGTSGNNEGPATLTEIYGKLAGDVARHTSECLEAPNEEGIHDLRVAIRRFQILVKQIPKQERRRSLRRYNLRADEFLRLTSEVRDLDIIRGRVGRQGRNSEVTAILEKLTRKRGRLLKGSLKAARRLRDAKKPKFEPVDGAATWRRMRETLESFDQEIPSALSVVVGSEHRVKELHKLKKEVRRFRYLLELMPQKQELVRTCESLRRLQDRLGEIRDSDVVIEYLARASRTRKMRELIDSEREYRDQKYRELVDAYSVPSTEPNQSYLARAGLARLA